MNEDHATHDKATKERIRADVLKYGWHVGLLPGHGSVPACAMSIGLYETFGHPEIIMFGLKQETMHTLINDMGALIREGRTFVVGQPFDGIIANHPIRFVLVAEAYYRNYLGYCSWYNGNTTDYPCLQAVWPDKESRFPWEEGFPQSTQRFQPLLDRNADFKFIEHPDTRVFTTQSVLDGNPVLRVHHNADGDWQFHHDEFPEVADARVVALGSIVQMDSTLNEIFDLNYGEYAMRTDRNAAWQYHIDEEE